MLFVIVLAIAIAGTVLAVVLDRYCDWRENLAFFFGVASTIAWVISAIMLIVIIVNNVGNQGTIASNEQRYESLVYQLESNLYDNDNDLGKKELYNQIQDWNEDLAKGKTMQHDFWFGVFYPKIYDHFEFIELE